MVAYYIELALRSLKRNRVLSALMVVAIGLGVGASMTMVTVLHVMSGDPLPNRSARLYVPMLDPRPLSQSKPASRNIPDGLTWNDAMNLLHARQADGQAAMASGSTAVHALSADSHPFFESGEYATSDFFSMFGPPFRAGAGWTAQQDQDRARVVVLNGELDRKLFGDATGLGRTVRLNDTDFRVIGVLDDWRPQPTFYEQAGHDVYGGGSQFFLPLNTALELKFRFTGHLSCWGSGGDDRRSAHCTWLQFWVDLDSPAKALAYRRFLNDYWHEQHANGRFPRGVRPRLFGMMEWLAHEHLIPRGLKMQLWLALGFLLVCMLNISALLLTKFMRRSGEISVRRAMGARRRDIFAQFGMESALIGVVGGVLGILIAEIGLWSVRQRPDGYAHLARMDVPMLLGALALAIAVSLLAGLLPAWRACSVPPALQLKTQ